MVRKLTDEQVAEIRRRRSAGERGRALAKEFGVTELHVSLLYTNQRRPDPAYQPPPEGKGRRGPRGSRLTLLRRLEVKELHACGARIIDLARTYGLHKSVVSRICNGEFDDNVRTVRVRGPAKRGPAGGG
jgi:hypothetical protein